MFHRRASPRRAGGAVEKIAAVVNAKLAAPLRSRLDARANIPERTQKILPESAARPAQ
jgi:hypothetical protein